MGHVPGGWRVLGQTRVGALTRHTAGMDQVEGSGDGSCCGEWQVACLRVAVCGRSIYCSNHAQLLPVAAGAASRSGHHSQRLVHDGLLIFPPHNVSQHGLMVRLRATQPQGCESTPRCLAAPRCRTTRGLRWWVRSRSCPRPPTSACTSPATQPAPCSTTRRGARTASTSRSRRAGACAGCRLSDGKCGVGSCAGTVLNGHA